MVLDRPPATLAQRLGVRVSESALTGVKVSHVLRGGAGERAGLAAGDELLAAGGWRLRRLDEALRSMAASGATRWLLSRDQRIVEVDIDIGSLGAVDGGAVQLRAAAEPAAEAAGLFAAWMRG